MAHNKDFHEWQKTPIIPPLLVNNDLIYNFRKRANIFNDFFVHQRQPIPNNNIIPTNQIFYTENRLRDFDVDCGEILRLVNGLNPHKALGHYRISTRKFKLRNLRECTLSM